MDKDTKLKIAKTLVVVDDSIASSGGIADFLGKIIAGVFSMLVGADLNSGSSSVVESEQVEAK